MTLSRRRFLAVSAALAAGPARADSWSGFAMGAEVAITLHGPREVTGPALAAARTAIDEVEARFSLYRPGSDLSQLNREGALAVLHPWMAAILDDCDRLHRVTQGHFDPTVQGLWTTPPGPLGWHRVTRGPGIALGPGQSLTLNGIAQGFGADRVAEVLQAHGLTHCLVNLGEFRALGGPWRIGIEDPAAGLLGSRSLTDAAIATSAPGALILGDGLGHIRNPRNPARAPLWSSVTVETASAALADGLSTAFCTMSRAGIAEALSALPDPVRVTLVDGAGDLSTLGT